MCPGREMSLMFRHVSIQHELDSGKDYSFIYMYIYMYSR